MNSRIPLLALVAFLGLQSCDTQIAGTNNETHTKGTFFQPDGQPATGARVRVFHAANDSEPVRQAYVDGNGSAPLTGLARGYYSLLVQDTSGRAAFLDSLYSDGDALPAPQDTVRSTATVVGHLRVQPMNSPAIAWIHLMRTGIYANVDSTGAFRITGVPSGALTLVATTLLPEYTPTFRTLKTQPDSTLDVGTIDLVYNGLPLVTGIVASCDSLSGVVTLTWKDTAYTRKNGYVIYRGQGLFPTPGSIGSTIQGSLLTNGIIGSAAAPTYADTVFGGFGAAPSRYDSAEMDLTYWVAAQSNDYSTGPIWNKAQIHVKSPALAHRWSVEWAPTIPLTGGVSVDTIAGGLAVLTDSGLQILSTGGTWTQCSLPSTPQAENPPVFWKGKIWMIRGAAVSGAVQNSVEASFGLSWNIFDSLRVLSSADGIHWDSTTIAAGRDSVTGFRLHASRDGLLVTATYQRLDMGSYTDNYSTALASWVSPDGSKWSNWSGIPAFLSGYDGNQTAMWNNFWRASVVTDQNDSAWTLFSPHSRTYLLAGESIDTTASLINGYSGMNVRASNAIMAFYDGSRFGLASPSSPAIWQTISTPEPLQNYSSAPPPFCFWQGKLVVLSANGIHIATIR